MGPIRTQSSAFPLFSEVSLDFFTRSTSECYIWASRISAKGYNYFRIVEEIVEIVYWSS